MVRSRRRSEYGAARRAAFLFVAAVIAGCQPAPSQTPQPSGSAVASTGQWGPLAVIPPQDGSDTGLAVGRLLITDKCVYLESAGEKRLLFWPADRTRWIADRREITFTNFDGTQVSASDGTPVNLAGGGDSASESGISGQDWVTQMVWVAPPDPSCSAEVRWGVGGVKR